jgi:hypothetical protein
MIMIFRVLLFFRYLSSRRPSGKAIPYSNLILSIFSTGQNVTEENEYENGKKYIVYAHIFHIFI